VDQAQRRQFVRDHRTCIFGYGRQEHGPAMTVVYYVLDGDDMLISTMAAREKAKAVARDGRISLCVLDEKWPLSYAISKPSRIPPARRCPGRSEDR
jgi:hypothetical protein